MATSPTAAAAPSSLPRVRPALEGSPETLLLPLYARALDAAARHPILADPRARAIVAAIDYDFSTVVRPGGGRVLVARARQLDAWAAAFLAAHRNAVVLNLGCGLDSRYERLAPPPSVAWFDVDLPEVIALRRRFFADTDARRAVAASVDDPGWWAELPGGRPVLAVADGLLVYLEADTVRALFHRLVVAFPHGRLVFDVLSPGALGLASRQAAQTIPLLRWTVDDLAEVDALEPRLRRTAALSALRVPFVGAGERFLWSLASISPRLRRAIRLLRYEF